MTIYTKPDMRRAWCNNGAKVQPSDTKIDLGWVAEKPPYQNENWLQNRADLYIQHLEERGAPNYDTLVIYNKGSRIFSVDQHWESLQNSNLGNSVTAGLGWWIPVRELENPVGMVAMWPTIGVPDGWLVCNGSIVSQATYSRLFSFIGQQYGGATGTFALPDYRGYALRGTDSGRGVDPDAVSRTDRGDGVTGDNVGTVQQDVFKTHDHSIPTSFSTGGGGGADQPIIGTGKRTGFTGGNETRMKNIGVNYIIRY